jgi:hypothetical protein
LEVSNTSYVKGQDFEAKDKYVSSHTTNHIPPSERLQRTAADIVGVPNTKVTVKEVKIGLFSHLLKLKEDKSTSLPLHAMSNFVNR